MAHRIEPFWDAQLATGAVIALDATLPAPLVLDARWVAPAVSGVLLLVLMAITPWNSKVPVRRDGRRRLLALGLIGLVALAHVGSLIALIVEIVGRHGLAGGPLLHAAAELWAATVLIFAVLYWELDRGGPAERSLHGPVPTPPPADFTGPWPDFLFPHMADDAPVPRTWMPAFADYLYLAATNSTAFSPTDVMPLSVRAKMLMLLQSTASFLLVALVAARAVNVLS